MKNFYKKLLPALFFAFILGACTALWFFDHGLFDRSLGFLLYMIGYGEAEGSVLTRFILAVAGIFLVGIFSSYITVTLLEQKSKLRIDNRLHLTLSETPKAWLPLKTRRWEIFDVQIKLIYWHKNTAYEETVAHLPYWNKKSPLDIDLNLQQGSVLYWYLQAIQEGYTDEQLILKLDFINAKNNQSYCTLRRYFASQLLTNGEKRPPSHAELAALCQQVFELDQLALCNEEYIHYAPVAAPLPFCPAFSDGIRAHFNLQNANANDFSMLLFREPFGGNWSYFQQEDYRLCFSIYTEKALNLKLEIKSAGRILQTLPLAETPGLHRFELSLQDFAREELQQLRELCFTIFCTEGTALSGEFYILDCAMRKAS